MRTCPFCGYDEGWIKPFNVGKATLYRVECRVCGAIGPKATTPKMAEWKWNGILAKIDNRQKFKETLDEADDDSHPYFKDMIMSENIGAPMATLGNVPGVGDAAPASSAGVTGSDMNSSDVVGSGDKWDNSTQKKKRKKPVRKKKK